MKVIKIGCLSVLFLVFCFFVYSQEKRIEEVLQDCIYSSLPDKGMALKKHIYDFEQDLIITNILEDRTAKSYYKLATSILVEENKNFHFSFSLIDSINKSSNRYLIMYNTKCFEELKNIGV